MKGKLIFFLCLVTFALGFVIHWLVFKSKPEAIFRTEIRTEVVHDTTIVYEKVPATVVYDTVYVAQSEPAIPEAIDTIIPRKASAEKTFPKYGTFSVDYFYPPGNYFDMRFQPFPREIIYETRYVPKPRRWYESQTTGFIAGVAATAVVIYLVK